MNRFVSTAIRAGVPFGIGMGLFNGLQRHDLVAGAMSGLAMGVAFGLAMAAFLQWQSKKFIAMRSEFSDEGLLHDGPATLRATGGWLFLTKQRLVFVPHKINTSTVRIELPIAGITAVSGNKRNLELATAKGSHVFKVDPRDDWQKHMFDRLALTGTAPTAG